MQQGQLPRPMPRLTERTTEEVVYYGNLECYHARYSQVVEWADSDGVRATTSSCYTVEGLMKTKLL